MCADASLGSELWGCGVGRVGVGIGGKWQERHSQRASGAPRPGPDGERISVSIWLLMQGMVSKEASGLLFQVVSSRSQAWESGRLLEVGQLSHQRCPGPNQSVHFGQSPPLAWLPCSFPRHPCPGPSWHVRRTSLSSQVPRLLRPGEEVREDRPFPVCAPKPTGK